MSALALNGSARFSSNTHLGRNSATSACASTALQLQLRRLTCGFAATIAQHELQRHSVSATSDACVAANSTHVRRHQRCLHLQQKFVELLIGFKNKFQRQQQRRLGASTATPAATPTLLYQHSVSTSVTLHLLSGSASNYGAVLSLLQQNVCACGAASSFNMPPSISLVNNNASVFAAAQQRQSRPAPAPCSNVSDKPAIQ